MTIRFDGKIAIVTGGGNGLGRQHCLQLAARGAKVVVNDLGGSVDGSGGSVTAAEGVAEEIRKGGGEAIGNGADITKLDQVEAMVAEAKAKWGRVDILINNASFLPTSRLNSVDLPTLGRPMMMTWGSMMRKALACSARQGKRNGNFLTRCLPNLVGQA